jgi:hypothetical protein
MKDEEMVKLLFSKCKCVKCQASIRIENIKRINNRIKELEIINPTTKNSHMLTLK